MLCEKGMTHVKAQSELLVPQIFKYVIITKP
jgi:hypothetical protein